MAHVTVSATFLGWLPAHGLPILLLFAVSSGAALAIYVTQCRRYSASNSGIVWENVDADITAVLWTAFAGVALGGLGVVVVLTV